MEEYPTACTNTESNANSEKYFQIKDEKTGFSEDFNSLVFSKSKGKYGMDILCFKKQLRKVSVLTCL